MALELAGETKLAAIAAEEPATVLFTGVFTSGTDLDEVMADPKRFYTPALRKFTQQKIRRISCPIFIANGSVHVINKINNEIFVPELKALGKNPEVIVYPGEKHGFSHGRSSPEAAQKFFKDCRAFFNRYLPTKPKPVQ